MNDVIGGHVPLLMDFVSTGAPHVRSGKARALVVTGVKRAKVLPDVPTVSESGLPDYEARAWFAVFAPAKTPRAIIARLHGDIAAVLAMPSVEKSLNDLGVEVTPAGPDELGALVQSEIRKWNAVVEKAGIPRMD
jgi:tripartite-type tricarboxylate transporter receptor subunit TctC